MIDQSVHFHSESEHLGILGEKVREPTALAPPPTPSLPRYPFSLLQSTVIVVLTLRPVPVIRVNPSFPNVAFCDFDWTWSHPFHSLNHCACPSCTNDSTNRHHPWPLSFNSSYSALRYHDTANVLNAIIPNSLSTATTANNVG